MTQEQDPFPLNPFMPYPVPPLYDVPGAWPPSDDNWWGIEAHKNPYWMIREWGLKALRDASPAAWNPNNGGRVWDWQGTPNSIWSPGFCCFGETYEDFVERINEHFLADSRTLSKRFWIKIRHFLYQRRLQREMQRRYRRGNPYDLPSSSFSQNQTMNSTATSNATKQSVLGLGSALFPRSEPIAMAASLTGATGQTDFDAYLDSMIQILRHSGTILGLKPGDIPRPSAQYAQEILPTAAEDRLLGMQFARVPYRVFLKDHWWREFWDVPQNDEYAPILNYGELYDPPKGLIPSRGLRFGERSYLRHFYEQAGFMDIVRNDWNDVSTFWGWEPSDFSSVEGLSETPFGEIKFAPAETEFLMNSISSEESEVPFAVLEMLNPFLPFDFNPGVPLGEGQEWMPGMIRPLFPGPTGGTFGAVERSKWWPYPVPIWLGARDVQPPPQGVDVPFWVDHPELDPYGIHKREWAEAIKKCPWCAPTPEMRRIVERFWRQAAKNDRWVRETLENLGFDSPTIPNLISRAFRKLHPRGSRSLYPPPGYSRPGWRPPWDGIPAYSFDSLNDTYPNTDSTGLPPPSYWENSVFNQNPNYTFGWFDWATESSFNGPPATSQSRNPVAEHSAKLWMWRFMTFHPSRVPPYGAVQISQMNSASMNYGTLFETESVSGYMTRPLMPVTQEEISDYVGYGNMLRNGVISNSLRKQAFSNGLG